MDGDGAVVVVVAAAAAVARIVPENYRMPHLVARSDENVRSPSGEIVALAVASAGSTADDTMGPVPGDTECADHY